MVFQYALGKRLMWLLPSLVAIASLAGCIADPTTPFQVRPETVLAPQNPFFSAPVTGYIPNSVPPSGTMLVRWNRSIADTQLNFKGYFVELHTSQYDSTLSIENVDSLVVDTASITHLPNTPLPDTFYTFHTIHPQGVQNPSTIPIPLGRYTAFVKSIKTSAADTIIYSADSSEYSGYFDPLPLQSPSNLQATSIGPTSIQLRWTLPVTDKDPGFYRYVVYYRDPSLPHDTGHVAATVLKGLGDTGTFVTVPPASGTDVTAQEKPYQFWVKSQRNDSTFFYGSDMYGPDTNSIVWAGSEPVPKVGNDSSGYLQVLNGKSMYFGSLNAQWDVAEDSSDNTGQVVVSIGSDSIVTLTVQSHNGALGGVGFLNRMDFDSSLNSVFYTGPLNDPTQFTQKSIPLPRNATNGGAIVYVMMNDDQETILGHMWARILIKAQANGTFVTQNGGIDIKGSFQPGVSKDGLSHLPYY